MFEVQDLRYATLATVSRCGMVWFSEDVLSTEMIFDNNLLRMKRVPIEEFEEETRRIKARGEEENALSPAMQVWKIKTLYEGEILIPFLSLNRQPKEPFAPKIPQFPEPKCQWNNSGEMYFSPHLLPSRQCLPQGLIYPLSPIFLSGKRELKQWRRWRQRERQKRNRLGWQNNNSARASRLFLNISLPSLHDYDVNLPNFTFCQGREHKATTFFFFSWTSIQSLRIQLQKK